MALPLPSRVCATYFTLWGGGSRITSVPTTYNQIYLFHAVPAGNGAFRFEYGNSVNAAEIKTCQARGQRVVLTVGGANAGFNFQTRAQSDAFVASFKQMNTALGGNLDGCDFNNFEARIGSSATEMTYIAQQLKAFYGSSFSITCPPGPGAGWAPNDRVLTKAMAQAGVIDYAGPQFYDSADLTQLGTITSLIDEWVANMGGDASKVVIGLSSNYGAGPTLATCQAAWKQCLAKYPKLRGVFAWSAQDDAGGSWNWGKTMGPLVGASPVTGTPAPTPAPAPSPAPTPPAQTKVTIAAPVLTKSAYAIGDALGGSVKVTTAGSAVTAAAVVLTIRPPGGTHGGGPFIDLYSGTNVALTVGEKTFSGTRPLTAADALGKWEVYGTWKDSAGAWYDGPSSYFELGAVAPTFKVGDRVKVGTNTGTITAISGTNATIKLDTEVTAAFSTLTKL